MDYPYITSTEGFYNMSTKLSFNLKTKNFLFLSGKENNKNKNKHFF